MAVVKICVLYDGFTTSLNVTKSQYVWCWCVCVCVCGGGGGGGGGGGALIDIRSNRRVSWELHKTLLWYLMPIEASEKRNDFTSRKLK